MTTSVVDDGWDRTLLDLSSKCVEPAVLASWAFFRVVTPLDPTKFDNCNSKIAEVAYRIFIILTAAVLVASIVVPVGVIVLGVLSKVLRAVGFALQKNEYTHVRGLVSEKSLEGEAKVMTWNVCGIGGGLHYNHGGVIDWRSRLDRIVEKIRSEDPDVLVLQEIYDTALAEAIIQNFKTEYAHFFTHLGANVIGSIGGLLVLSKCAFHSFKNESFQNNHWFLNRTFASLEIKARPEDPAPCARIIGTHLIHDNNDERIEQIDQILSYLQSVDSLPTVLMGDLNLERDDPEQGGLLNPHFMHGYLDGYPTRTNVMLHEWDEKLVDPGDFIDYISLYRGGLGQLQEIHLIPAYDATFDTKSALSDHNGLAGRIIFSLDNSYLHN